MRKKLTVLLLFIILGFYLPNVFSAAVTFNVYQDKGPEFTVSGINVDCNGTAYDRTNKTSPFTINFDDDTYECKFTNINKDWKETTVQVDETTTNPQRVEMEFKNYPVVYQFLQNGSASTRVPNSFQTIATWTYEPNFGSDTTVQVGCVLEVASDFTKKTSGGEWEIQSSDDGVNWTTQGTVSRALTSDMIGSVYISTKAWTVSDGTRYFRLRHQRITNNPVTVTSRKAVCNLFTNKSDSNSTIKTDNFVVGTTTVNSTEYSALTTRAFNSSAYNGMLFILGSINYMQGPTSSSTISFRMNYNGNTVKAEYPRYVNNGTNASGSFAEFVDVNANQNTNLVFEGKRELATSSISIPGVFVYQLSQDEEDYNQISLANKTVSSANYVPIASMTLSKDTNRGIYVSSTAPVTCSMANCQVDMQIQVIGETYDRNSNVFSRTFPTTSTYGTIKNQFVFEDVNDKDVNVILWAKASSGTATIHGGNFIALTVNQQKNVEIIDVNLSLPYMIKPESESYHRRIVDFNCYSDNVGPNIKYDVNLLKKSGGSFVATLMTDGNGAGNFDSNNQQYPDGRYTFACKVKDIVTGKFADMDDPGYWLFIDNTAPITTDNSDDEWHATNQIITLTATDMGGSDINHTKYCVTENKDEECTPNEIGTIANVTCSSNDICEKYVRYYSVDNVGNQEETKTSKLVKINSSVPGVGQTKTSGFSISTNYIKGTGKIIGGTVTGDVNTDSCEYTTNGTDWNIGTYVLNHCESEEITITDGTSYTFNTRIKNLAGTPGTGTPTITYTGDLNAPSVGETTVSGFTTYNNYISDYITGNGNVIGGEAIDTGSGIDTTSCEYTLNNGFSWQIGSWLIDHCVSETVTISNGVNYQFNTRVKDKLNNQGIGTATIPYIGDVEKPVTTISGTNSNYVNSNVTVSLSCSDVGAGCKETYYSFGGSEYIKYNNSFTILTDGKHTINYYSVDYVNNVETTKTGYVYIDKTPPVTTDNSELNVWYSSNVNITLTATDNNSGVDYTKYCVDDSNTCDPKTEGTIGTVVNVTCDEGNACQKYVRYYSVDNAGNQETPKASNLIQIDKSYPTVGQTTVSGFLTAGSYFKGEGKVVGGYTYDTNGSDLNTDSCQYTIDGNNWLPAEWKTDHCESPDFNVYDDVTYIFNTRIANNNGRIGTGTSVNYTGDCTPPVITGETTYYDVTIYDSYFKGIDGFGKARSGTIVDEGAGIDTTTCEFTINNGSTWLPGIWETDHCRRTGTIKTGIQYFSTFRVKDKLGNTQIAPYAIAYIGDDTAPTTTIFGTTTDWSRTDKNITLTCDDNGLSGCASTNYRINNGVWQTYSSYFNLPDGSYQIDYYSVDNLSNIENTKTDYYYQDQVAPVTIDNSDDLWHSGVVDITLVPSDETSGVAQTYYCIDIIGECNPETPGTQVAVTCESESQCQKYVRYYSVDNAENKEDIKTSRQIKIDTSNPIVDETTTSGFIIYEEHIRGTGRVIGGYVYDSDAGINTDTCKYTIDGVNWLPANWVIDHCESPDFNIYDDMTYIFNTSIENNSSPPKTGYGTATIAYTGDLIAPSVGNTGFSGFTTFFNSDFNNTYIKGTGKVVGGKATDTGSGIDTTSCQYTTNDGNTWQPGIWVLDHCESPDFSILLDTNYIFNTRVKDNLGTPGTGTETIKYLEDITAPDSVLYGLNNIWNNTDVNLDLNCEGHKSGCKSTTYRVDNGEWITTIALSTRITLTTDANHIIEYYSTDNLDTSGVKQTSYMAVDTTKPRTTDNSDNSWHATNVNITLSPYDATSGIKHTKYCITEDKDSTCDPTTGTIGTIVNVTCPSSSVCEKYVMYYSVDNADNNETTKTSNLVKIDKSYPLVGLTTTSGFSIFENHIKGEGKVIGGKITDTNGSGLDTNSCEYTKDGSSWDTATRNAEENRCESGNITIENGTNYSFNTRIRDALGKQGSGISTIIYTGDLLPPVFSGEIQLNNVTVYGNYFKGTGNITSGTITDAGVGVDTTSCEFTDDDGINWTDAVWETDHCVRYGTAIDGKHYKFAFRVKDKLDNNKTGLCSEEYIGDTSSPITTISGTTTDWSKTDKNITLTCDDNGLSGCRITKYRINNGAWFTYPGTFTISNDGNHHIDYYSVDNIGNEEALKLGIVAVDKTPPVTTDNSDTSWHSGNVNIILNPIDNVSGVKQTYYCIDTNGECNPQTPGIVVPVTCESESQCQKYVRYYSVDNAGNEEDPKTSNLVKIDTSYPVVDDTTISGFTTYNNYIKGTGKVIGGYVHDTGSDINTSTCEYTIDGSSWFPAEWKIDHCESPERTIINAKTYTFNTRIKNNAGSIGTGTPTITYIGDTQAPAVGATTVTGFSIYNDFINHSGIVVSGTATDNGSGINTTTCLYSANDGNTWKPGIWTDNHCESPTFSVSEGSKIFKTRVSDNLGNVGTGEGTQSYIVDSNAPTTTATEINDGWNTTDIDINLTCDDGNGSGCKSSHYRINNGEIKEYTRTIVFSSDGNHLFKYRSVDNVDNYENIQTAYIAIDKTPPETTDNSDNQWHATDLNITLSPYDATSGIDYTRYCVDDSNSCSPNKEGTVVEITCLENSICEKYVVYYSVDNAGNEEDPKTSNLVKIDKNYPAVGQTETIDFSISENYITGTGRVIGGKITDTNGAGLDTNSCEYTTDGLSWYPANWNADENRCESDEITIINGTNYIFNTRIEDDLNRLATGIPTIKYTGDTLPPTISSTTLSEDFNVSGLFINGTGTIFAYASDVGSGIRDCNYTIDGNNWQPATWNATNGMCISESIIITDGNKYSFNLRATDNLSNTRNALGTDTYTGDTKSPTTSIVNDNPNTWRKGPLTLYFDCNDFNGSGCDKSYYDFNNETYQYYDSIILSSDGNHELTYYSKDKVGNYEVQKTTYVAIDNDAPITIDNSDNNWHANDRTITLTATDDWSGVKHTYYCVDTLNACIPTEIGTNVSVNCPEGTCVKYIRYFSQDNADNNETIKFTIVKIDKNAPEINLTKRIVRRTAIISVDANEHVTCRIDTNTENDNFDGASSDNEKQGTNLSWTFDNLSIGNYQYFIYCKDRAHNNTNKDVNFEITSSSSGGGSKSKKIIYVPEENNEETEDSQSQNSTEILDDDAYTLVYSDSKIGEDGIIIIRTTEITITKKNGTISKANAQYIISIYNPSTKIVENVLITEYIPKEIANDVSDIDFTTYPTRIVSRDPIVEWLIPSISPGQTIDLNYTIKKVAQKEVIDNKFISNAKMTDMALLRDEEDLNEILEESDCVNGICSKVKHDFSWVFWIIGIIIILLVLFLIIERKRKPDSGFPKIKYER